MKTHTPDFLRNFKFEYKITLTYLLFGLLWILFSDKVLDILVPDAGLLTKFQTFKGGFFIFATSTFLYLLVKRHMQKLRVAESQRIESESHYRALFNDNLSVIVLINPETGKIEDANQAACNYYGWTHSELCKKSISDINTSDVKQITANLESVVAESQNHFVTQHRLANNELRDVEIFSGPIHLGNKIRIYSHVHDVTEQNAALRIITKNEERYRNTLDQMLEGCQIIGFDWKYIYINDSAEIHNKRPKEELIGQRYIDIWPGIEETKVFQFIKQTLDDRVSSHFENEFLFPDGSRGWFDLSIQPVPEGVFILSIDITERKKAEKNLSESEEKYRLIADNSDDWIYWIAPDGHLHYVSPACERVTGYSPAEFAFLPELNHKIVFEADREKVSEHTSISKLEKNPHNLEFRIVTKNGEIRWISHSCSPIFGDSGEYLGRRGTNRNITERKLQEKQLYESEFRFSKLYENGPFGMVMADKEFRFKKANPAFCTIMGYSEPELQQLTFKDISHSDDLVKDLPNIRKLINKEISVYKTEKKYIRKDGLVIWGSLTVSTAYDSEGQFLYTLGIIEDITPRKLVEEALREREKKLSTILNLLPVGISILDQDQKIVYVNPALEKILGITKEGLQRGDYRERKYLRSDGTLKLAEEFASVRAFSENSAQHNNITGVVKEDGNIVWTTVSAVPVEFADWKVVLVTADITNLKRTEEALKKSKHLLTETESIGKVGGWEFNVDTMGITWTDEVYRIHEVESDFDPNVNKGINFYTPASRPIIEKAVQRAIQFGESFDLELEISTAKGNLRKVHTIGKADLENRRVYGFFQDITERKLAEDELMKTRNQLAKIFETSPGIVCTSHLRPDGTVCFPFGGERLAVYFGIPTAHLEEDASPYFALIHPDDLKSLLVSIEESSRNLTPWRYEWRMLHPVNGLMWIEGHSMPVREQDGSTLWHGVATDITERKRAEEKIRELNERISTATRASQVGIWDWDIMNGQLTWDDQMYALYGLKKGEFAGAYEAWVNGLHPEDREFSQYETQLALRSEKEYDTEFRVIWLDETIHFIKAKGEVYRDENGDPARMVGINYDITEQKKTDQKIREKDQEFRKLSANVPDLLFQFTRRPDGTYFVPIASEGIRNIFGCSPEDVLEDFGPIGKVIYPEDVERVIRDIEYSAEHLTFFTCEFRVQIPGREIQWIYSKSTPEKLTDGSITWYGFNTDITSKKLAEEALRESEEKFRGLMENIPIPVTYVNKTGEIIFRNDRFLEVIGYTSEEVPTIKEWWLLAYPSVTYRQWVIKNWESSVDYALETNTDILPKEYNIVCKDGSERIFIISGILINDNLLITFIDITDRKKAEEEIRKLNETLEQRVENRTAQLKEANQELEAFSYSVSHDLRAPLRHINGYVDLLKGHFRDQLPEKGKYYLDTIHDSSVQMGALIDDLLQFSRTGRQEMHRADVDMNLLLQDVMNSMKNESENRNFNWQIDKLPLIYGDSALLRLVWFNLLSNAVKFTREKKIARIHIKAEEDQNEYSFSVSDNGSGFDMRYAHKLFGVFQRLHSQKDFEGTGIGLANVRRIILKHGGRTWAESRLGHGAKFYFTLPKNKEA